MATKIPVENIRSILATDCGSTTTKAILIEKQGDEYRLVVRGEAPTTVEAPVEDVTRGVMNAIGELEELIGRKIVENDAIVKPCKDNKGVDVYISTSSAGGGLQMMVAGVIKAMSAESAARAALGAGAIVMDTIASNDGRLPHQKIDRIRKLRPDMILFSGGIDGGTTKHVADISQILAAADPRPRFGVTFSLPVIYAGNKDARGIVEESLSKKTALTITENLRPVLERENLLPARHLIHDQFLEHVMQQAPGYKKLMEMTDYEIEPTPGAVGTIMQRIAREKNMQILGVDIGGATTDVFSVFQGIYNRTVSANFGMSYSISNTVTEAGLDNVLRWIPFDMDERDLMNRVKNKMIRPTSIPQLLEELIFEQAVAREALRLSLIQHKEMAVGLKGVQKERSVSDVFNQKGSETLVNMTTLNMIIGSGGVLSHSPRRNQSAIMMMDAFLPEGITQLTVDSIFMMPQLGVLASFHPAAAAQVFDKDCLIYLGTCVAPIGAESDGKKCLEYKLTMPDGKEESGDMVFGDLRVIPLGVGESAKLWARPVKSLDLGAGPGVPVEETVHGGVVGVIFDTRGRRPFELPSGKSERVAKMQRWLTAMNAYPKY
ncbi:MAG: glutamate mutase L [Candidatus Wallbacteria bacterium]|nr:glutamate mutase L [Candidatus Wallbacteria bacterium]